MTNNMVYETRPLEEQDYKAFSTVYNDFRNRAVIEYKFELEPLDYEGFVDAIEKNLLTVLFCLKIISLKHFLYIQQRFRKL